MVSHGPPVRMRSLGAYRPQLSPRPVVRVVKKNAKAKDRVISFIKREWFTVPPHVNPPSFLETRDSPSAAVGDASATLPEPMTVGELGE